VASLPSELVELYERQRARGDRGEMARITAAADDEVLRCPECNAILVRAEGFRK
jgi:predicted  nucleic acid-binding Zn-ribbon protein